MTTIEEAEKKWGKRMREWVCPKTEELVKMIDSAKDKIDVGDYAYAKNILDELKRKLTQVVE